MQPIRLEGKEEKYSRFFTLIRLKRHIKESEKTIADLEKVRKKQETLQKEYESITRSITQKTSSTLALANQGEKFDNSQFDAYVKEYESTAERYEKAQKELADLKITNGLSENSDDVKNKRQEISDLEVELKKMEKTLKSGVFNKVNKTGELLEGVGYRRLPPSRLRGGWRSRQIEVEGRER